MRNPPFINGYYYHVFNRGVEKRKIFLERRDYQRFLETLDYYQLSPQPVKLSDFRRGISKIRNLKGQKQIIKIHCYCLMPNHFHLLIQQLGDSGISEFLRKISDSYTKYFNTKYERVGSLFQGPFKARLVETEGYLLHLSKYIHRNSFVLPGWNNKVYPYSSYRNYILGKNSSICDTKPTLFYFSSYKFNLSYQAFVEEIDIKDNLPTDLLIDLE